MRHRPIVANKESAEQARDILLRGDMIRMRFAIAVAAALLALAGTGCGGASNDKAGGVRHDPIVLTLAVHETGRAVQEWIDAVERLSGGSLQIEVKRGWRGHEVNYEKSTVADVRSGKVDLASIPARAYDTFGVRNLQALLGPFLIDSYALERKVLSSDLPDQMLLGVKPLGVVGIALLPGELQKMLSFGSPMLAPSDYRGTRIGIRPSEVAARTFRTLGATPRSLAPGGDISGLDGAEQDVFQIVASRYLDVAGETLPVNLNFWPRVASIVMNHKEYDALAPEQRESLRNGDREALGPTLKRLAHDQDNALDVICDVPPSHRPLLFLSATSSNLAAMRRAVRRVYRPLQRDPATRRAIKSIAAMRKDVIPEPVPSCPGRPLRPVSANAGSAATVNVAGDLTKTGATTWEGPVTSKQLGRGRLVLAGHVYFSKRFPRRYLKFKADFSGGELRGCVFNVIVPRPNGDYGWNGPGDIAGASGALRKYVGLTLRFGGITRKGDLRHMRGGFRTGAPTGLACF
jgi:TRAP-type C4-dicarboxylate transport system substrate-binding protein